MKKTTIIAYILFAGAFFLLLESLFGTYDRKSRLEFQKCDQAAKIELGTDEVFVYVGREGGCFAAKLQPINTGK